MAVTRADAATMRLDGGHPALDLVNTVYGGPHDDEELDVLQTPADLVTFARRVGVAGPTTRGSAAALAAAVGLRDALDGVLRALLAGRTPPARQRAAVEAAARRAADAGRLARRDGALIWTWPERDSLAPVHRLATVALELLGDADALARLRRCTDCRWLFVDRSRGTGRRWCSMADCGTEAKKRRYVARRREQRAGRATVG